MIDPAEYDHAAMWPQGPDDPGSRRITVRRQIEAWEAVPEEQRMTFEDMLDVVNPLQHIPVVSTAYRELTGDEIGGPARILGGFLYGGPVGFASAMVESVVAESTGRDFGEHAVAMVFGEDDAPIETAPTGTYADAQPDGTVLPSAGLDLQPAAAPTAVPDDGQPASAGLSMAPIPGQAAVPINGDSRLDAALMALALQSEQSAPGSPQHDDGRTGAVPPAEAAPFAGWPRAVHGRQAPVPEYGQAMTEALDSYQALTRATAPTGQDATPPAGGLIGTY